MAKFILVLLWLPTAEEVLRAVEMHRLKGDVDATAMALGRTMDEDEEEEGQLAIRGTLVAVKAMRGICIILAFGLK